MRKKPAVRDTTPPNLMVPRAEAERRIRGQMEKGQEIRDKVINSEQDLQGARGDKSKWHAYNADLLTRLFDNDSIAREYDRGLGSIAPHGAKLGWFVHEFRRKMEVSITRLESVLERLELIPQPEQVTTPSYSSDETGDAGTDVFIVHGHDEEAKLSVARFLEKLQLNPIILHERPNEGRTIIEKFEDYSNVGFAIVILTPDDIGGPRNEPDKQKPRARQNVIFELGYFIGKIGRGRVCALYKEGVEMPSDYDGVLYVPLGPDDAWQLKIAKEMKQAGLTVDLNRIIK